MSIFKMNDLKLKKWHDDIHQIMDKTIWINPNYKGIEEDGMSIEYERCFSIPKVAGPVSRFNKIKYFTYDFIKGKEISGSAEGFLARVIQHEIDHVHSLLFTSYVSKEKQLPIERYFEMRRQNKK
jgi:peptide deformylase